MHKVTWSAAEVAFEQGIILHTCHASMLFQKPWLHGKSRAGSLLQARFAIHQCDQDAATLQTLVAARSHLSHFVLSQNAFCTPFLFALIACPTSKSTPILRVCIYIDIQNVHLKMQKCTYHMIHIIYIYEYIEITDKTYIIHMTRMQLSVQSPVRSVLPLPTSPPAPLWSCWGQFYP